MYYIKFALFKNYYDNKSIKYNNMQLTAIDNNMTFKKKKMPSKYNKWYHPYKPAKEFNIKSAYFSMEFGIDQAFHIYSGGLGFYQVRICDQDLN